MQLWVRNSELLHIFVIVGQFICSPEWLWQYVFKVTILYWTQSFIVRGKKLDLHAGIPSTCLLWHELVGILCAVTISEHTSSVQGKMPGQPLFFFFFLLAKVRIILLLHTCVKINIFNSNSQKNIEVKIIYNVVAHCLVWGSRCSGALVPSTAAIPVYIFLHFPSCVCAVRSSVMITNM